MSLALATLAAGAIAAGASMYNNYKNREAQKRENEIIRSREDNAVQRQVNDLRAAGLSPLMATGSGASAGVTTAPSMTENPFSGFSDSVMGYMSMKTESAQQKLIKAQTDYQDELTRQAKAYGVRNYSLAGTAGYMAVEKIKKLSDSFDSKSSDSVLDHSKDASVSKAVQESAVAGDKYGSKPGDKHISSKEWDVLDDALKDAGWSKSERVRARFQADHWREEKWNLNDIMETLLGKNGKDIVMKTKKK